MADLTAEKRRTPRERARSLTPALVSVVVAAIWIGLALNRPSSTFHFAPAVAAAAWPVAARIRLGSAPVRGAAATAAGALVLTVVATLVLQGLDGLQGPDLFGGSAALEESLIAAGIGAAWGGWVLTRTRPGPLLSLIGIPADTGDSPEVSDGLTGEPEAPPTTDEPEPER